MWGNISVTVSPLGRLLLPFSHGPHVVGTMLPWHQTLYRSAIWMQFPTINYMTSYPLFVIPFVHIQDISIVKCFVHDTSTRSNHLFIILTSSEWHKIPLKWYSIIFVYCECKTQSMSTIPDIQLVWIKCEWISQDICLLQVNAFL